MIKIKGSRTGDFFEVAFMAGKDTIRSNQPFLIRVLKKEKKIIFNDRTNEQLGKEISKKDPFKDSDEIDLRVRVKNDRFQVNNYIKIYGYYE